MVKAIKLILKEETTFDLFFYDGSVKRYDILNLADKYPQLNKLKDRSLFLKGKLIGYSGVIFDDELDIDAQTVYEEGIDCRDEYDDVELVVLGYKVKEARLKLKSTSGWNGDGNGTDDFGFSALPAGGMFDEGYYDNEGNRAYFWSSMEYDDAEAYYMYLYFFFSDPFQDVNLKFKGFNVRCLKD